MDNAGNENTDANDERSENQSHKDGSYPTRDRFASVKDLPPHPHHDTREKGNPQRSNQEAGHSEAAGLIAANPYGVVNANRIHASGFVVESTSPSRATVACAG